MVSSARDVFINCPFGDDFAESFRGLVFSVIACGYRARCAKEVDDAAETRIEKIYRIIEQCRYGIHDISKTELDEQNGLPRFNMPLELGIFLGAKRFGEADQKLKRCMVLAESRTVFTCICPISPEWIYLRIMGMRAKWYAWLGTFLRLLPGARPL